MTRLHLAAVVALLSAATASAASPNPKDLAIAPGEMSKARVFIRLLGSEVHKEREMAERSLAKMGRLARPALLEALALNSNPEIRTRSARLLPRAEAADLQARIDTFLADADSKYNHDLPGLKLFRKESKTKDPSVEKSLRALYVEAIKSPGNLELLRALGMGREAAGRAIADRRMSLFIMQNPGVVNRFNIGSGVMQKVPSLADVGVLLLAESTVEAKDIPRTQQFGHITAVQFVQIQQAMQAVNNPSADPLGKAYRYFFVRWLDTRTAPEELNNIAWMANNFRQVKETGDLLKRIVTTRGVLPYAQAQGMIFLLQRGKENMPIVRTQLKNETNLNNGKIRLPNNVLIDTQVRDVALALILHYEGQDLKKYGFLFSQGFNMSQVAVNYWGYGFKSDEDRKAAYKKYQDYEQSKKKGASPKPGTPKK